MTSRFPEPWRIAEFPNGLAVYDATGRQLAFFYGRADPNMTGHAGFLMIDDAGQIAVDFARLPELLNQTSGRNEVATSTEDDNLAKLETDRTPQGEPETSHLLRAAQLSVITATVLPSAKAQTTIRGPISFEPDGRRSPQMSRRPSKPLSIWTKFLIPIAVGALAAGYLFFGDSDPPVNVAVIPQVTTNRLSAEFSPLPEAKTPLSKASDITVESRIEPEVQTAPLQPTALLDIKPVESGIEPKPSPPLPDKGRRSFAAKRGASSCFPSASAVRENHPGAWPSWTFRAPGHESTRCWYAAARITAHHQNEMRRKETVPTTEKLEGPPLLGVQ